MTLHSISRLILIVLLITVSAPIGAPQTTPSSPSSINVQSASGQSNVQLVSSSNASVAKTITGSAGTRAQLYSVSAYCSAGSASLTVTDGGTTIWSTPSGAITTTQTAYNWTTALAAITGNTMVITLSTCGMSNTGTLNVQTSQF